MTIQLKHNGYLIQKPIFDMLFSLKRIFGSRFFFLGFHILKMKLKSFVSKGHL